ncbi:unnamed protein product [Lota lota]
MSVEALRGPQGRRLCCVSFIRAIPATSLICRSPAATGRPMPRTSLTHRMSSARASPQPAPTPSATLPALQPTQSSPYTDTNRARNLHGRSAT